MELPDFASSSLAVADKNSGSTTVRCRWWLKRGVGGFRLDAVDVMYVDAQFRDNPVVGNDKNAFGDPVEREIYDKNQPEITACLSAKPGPTTLRN